MAVTGKGGNRCALNEDTFPKDGLPSRQIEPKTAQEYWTVLMSQIPNQLLRRIDTYHLTTLCDLLVQKDKLSILMANNPDDHKTTRCYLNVAQQINRLSSMFGMSPLDRRRMKLEQLNPSDDADEWSDD